MRTAWGMGVLAMVAVACSNTVGLSRVRPIQDAGRDAGPAPDAGVDAGVDAGPGPVDAGPPADAGTPDGGWSGAWGPVGPPLGQEAQVYPALALDPSGALLVAFAEQVEAPGTTTTELHVLRWAAGAWQPLGGVVASSMTRFPYSAPLWLRLGIDGGGRPVLAFGDSGPGSTSGAFPVQTWVFDGRAWQAVPVPGAALQLAGIALARGADGRLSLAVSTGRELDVLTLEAEGWTPAVAPLVDDAGVSEPDLALAADGTPHVAYSEAAAPGSFGALHATRWSDAGWTDLGVPSPAAPGLLFHTPRVRVRTDGGVVVTASEWQYDPNTKLQDGVGVPVLALGVAGWALLDDQGPPGGSGLSEPIPGAPVGLQLAADEPVVVSTGFDGGVILRALGMDGGVRVAPVLGGLGAGTLLLARDGTPIVGAVMPLPAGNDPSQFDGGQVQILGFSTPPPP